MKNQFPKAIVIAINKDLPVRDDAGIFFAQRFYNGLFDGQKIETAFDEAKQSLRDCHPRY